MPLLSDFKVNNNEFCKINHSEYTKMQIYGELGEMERIVSFLKELALSFDFSHLVICYYTHGGYIPIECIKYYKQIDTWNFDINHSTNLLININQYSISNINILKSTPTTPIQVCFYQSKIGAWEFLSNKSPIIFICPSSNEIFNSSYIKFQWDDTGYDVFIHISIKAKFIKLFLNNDETSTLLKYDNLLHFCMIVKNGGPQLEQMLIENAPYFDRWTILDTGSTDNTIEIIEKVLKNKCGKLYRGDFVDFSETRNQCLDLAEKQYTVSSRFYIMLDDTYIIKGKLREFLKEIRGDKFANSFSLYVSSNDCNYVSNRIIKSESKLRYKFRIHEVLEDKGNINVVIPKEICNILDGRFDYMETRTMDRKLRDIEWLKQEIEDNPTEPRHYYYMAQTYMLLEEYEKAYEYFTRRFDFTNSGFIQERIDAVFEMARLANFKLNRPWTECQKLYEIAFQIDPSRPESLYFIGIHYFLENNYILAYDYFKRAFILGFPEHCQHSLKPTLSFHFVPKYLAKVCYFIKDYHLGFEAVDFFLKNNSSTSDGWNEIKSWQTIYKVMLEYKQNQDELNNRIITTISYEKPLCVMIVDGGFEKWTGSDILTKGVGGSETCMIELAQNIQSLGTFQVIIFCRCSNKSTFRGVEYHDLSELYSFINSQFIHTCIISRFTEYLAPLSKNNYIENLYLILHDLVLPQTVIVSDKVKRIFCLTDWHSQYLKEMFPSLTSIIETFSYGIDFKTFDGNSCNKIPHSFIYSSYPERGLLPLLQCWSRILNQYPDATLHIFCNLDNDWSNKNYKEHMNEIRRLLNMKMSGIYNHGWVKKSILAEQWKQTEYWFYPCIFQETFCLTALEAATSKTKVITNDLAALQNTAHTDRTLCIPGNCMTMEWQDKALQILFDSMKNPTTTLINKNYQWAKELTWFNRAIDLNQLFNQDKLETRGMRNWFNNIPCKEETETFQSILTTNIEIKDLKEIQILEIGVWSGLSIIFMIQLLQKTYNLPVKATAIDIWDNYSEGGEIHNIVEWGIETSFDKNIKQVGLESCIRKQKGRSFDILQRLVKANELVDFIYIDGSHTAFDCFADLILSWQILKPGGIIGIDDYSFDDVSETIALKQGIDKFLDMMKSELFILYKGYRVFIKKI